MTGRLAPRATTGQRIVYNPVDGALLSDQDGAGAIAQVRFATLDANLALDNADFSVIA